MGAGNLVPEAATAATDDELLARIAQREQDALAELCRRYERAAFNLALYLTGDRPLAEEAVQEAMLRVWLKAPSYQPGNARGWIMSITGNAACLLARKQARQRKRDRQAGASTPPPAAKPAANEHDELLAGLRAALEQLSQQDRQMVALYYGAELSQDLIARELDLPQRTVSFKLQQALETLRRTMAQMGFAAAAPVSAELFWKLCNSGQAAPAGLAEQALRQALAAADGASRRAAVIAPRWSFPWLPVALAVVLLAAGAGWALLRTPVPAPQPPQAAVVAPEPAAPAVPADRMPRAWTFPQSDSGSDLKLLEGMWLWKPPTDSLPGRMSVQPESGQCVIEFPVRVPHQPFEVRIEIEPGSVKSNFDFGVNYFGNKLSTIGNRRRPVNIKPNKQTVLQCRMVFSGSYLLSYLDGYLVAMVKFASPYPEERLAMGSKNSLDVLAIRIRTLEENEITGAVADPQKAFDTFVEKRELLLIP